MIPSEVIRKVRLIEIKTRKIVNNLFGGEYHSAFKGMGMEFAEVREYSTGDDIRAIDWNVTARVGKPFIKKYNKNGLIKPKKILCDDGNYREGRYFTPWVKNKEIEDYFLPKILSYFLSFYDIKYEYEYRKKRDEIVKKLKENNIQTNINYPFPIHKMKAYKNKILNKFNYLPMTEKMAKGIFSLPLYPKLKENKVLKITKILQKILRSI